MHHVSACCQVDSTNRLRVCECVHACVYVNIYASHVLYQKPIDPRALHVDVLSHVEVLQVIIYSGVMVLPSDTVSSLRVCSHCAMGAASGSTATMP